MSWSRLLRRASLLLLLCILARILTSSLFDLDLEPQMLPHFRVVRGNSSSVDDVRTVDGSDQLVHLQNMSELLRLWFDVLTEAEKQAFEDDAVRGLLDSLAPSLHSAAHASTMEGKRTWDRVAPIAKRALTDLENKSAAEGT